MLTLRKHRTFMEEQAWDISSWSLIAVNAALGVALVDYLNIAAAVTGVCVTILANVGRIAHSIVYVIELHRAGWRLQKSTNDEPSKKEGAV